MRQNEILSSIIRQIFRGNAILFVGAGFSKNAIGFNGEMPIVKELKEIILNLMGENEDGADLSSIADYFINN